MLNRISTKRTQFDCTYINNVAVDIGASTADISAHGLRNVEELTPPEGTVFWEFYSIMEHAHVFKIWILNFH